MISWLSGCVRSHNLKNSVIRLGISRMNFLEDHSENDCGCINWLNLDNVVR